MKPGFYLPSVGKEGKKKKDQISGTDLHLKSQSHRKDLPSAHRSVPWDLPGFPHASQIRFGYSVWNKDLLSRVPCIVCVLRKKKVFYIFIFFFYFFLFSGLIKLDFRGEKNLKRACLFNFLFLFFTFFPFFFSFSTNVVCLVFFQPQPQPHWNVCLFVRLLLFSLSPFFSILLFPCSRLCRAQGTLRTYLFS